jgi:hypothetical protein
MGGREKNQTERQVGHGVNADEGFSLVPRGTRTEGMQTGSGPEVRRGPREAKPNRGLEENRRATIKKRSLCRKRQRSERAALLREKRVSLFHVEHTEEEQSFG